jgi:pantetheine-phosphate adenylyltransferase
MERVAVFPGSFDPITLGHTDIIRKALGLFDRVIIGIGSNADKEYMFPAERREKWIAETFHDEPRVSVKTYEGLTTQFCIRAGANYIVRGIRNAADFEFEKSIAHINESLPGKIETVFILSALQYNALSSSIVRDIIRNGGNASQFLPDVVKP